MDPRLQNNPTNHGASKASDFQPPTGNPQQTPGELFPESQGVQSSGSEDLLQNGNARISVPNNPAPASEQSVTEAKSGGGAVVVAVIVAAVIMMALHAWRLRRRQPKVSEPMVEAQMEPVVPKPAVKTKAVSPPKKVAKKPAPKKSKSKRKKRARS